MEKMFAQYITSLFLPYVVKVRSKKEIEQEEAALLMDSCSNHLATQVTDMLTTARVQIITFAPHTTHIFQLLDMALFGTFEQVGKYHLPVNGLGMTSRFLYRLYMDFKRMLTGKQLSCP
jgi:hypothetical protein